MPKIDVYEKYKYLIGTKINKWTVLDIKNNRSHPDAICVCECGTLKPVNIRNLIHNATKDCGCGRKAMLSATRSKDLVGQRFGKLEVIEALPKTNEYNRKVYKCLCDCGSITYADSCQLVTGGKYSCGCLNSYYNLYIHRLLDKLNIEHIAEYTIWVGERRFRFDFYLPQYNLAIEYDGEGHYMPIKYWAEETDEEAEAMLLGVQERDKIKNKYCEDNKINLLRIPYWEKGNIDEIINNCLQRLSESDPISQ